MEVKISLVIVSVLVFFGAVYWYKIVDILKHFFLHQTHPVNLAIFRIVVFAWIFRKCGKGFIHFFADFPQELMFVPFGLNWIVPHLPIDSSITAVVAPVCQLFALLGHVWYQDAVDRNDHVRFGALFVKHPQPVRQDQSRHTPSGLVCLAFGRESVRGCDFRRCLVGPQKRCGLRAFDCLCGAHSSRVDSHWIRVF